MKSPRILSKSAVQKRGGPPGPRLAPWPACAGLKTASNNAGVRL